MSGSGAAFGVQPVGAPLPPAPEGPDEILEEGGTLTHCGIPMSVEGRQVRYVGHLELVTIRVHCNACQATGTLALRVPVGRPGDPGAADAARARVAAMRGT